MWVSTKNKIRCLGLLVLFALVLVVSGLLAQSTPEALGRGHEFRAMRIKYTPNRYDPMTPRYGPPWYHDYPTSETNLMRAVKEFTLIDVHHSPVIVTLDDPDLFKYPWAYLCEVGFFSPTDEEVKNMREYMNRGGLLIVDDFSGGRDWQHFQMELKRILPDRKFEPMKLDHPLLRSFFNIDNLDFPDNYRGPGQVYYIADDKGRLMMVINVNLDVSEYWEWAGTSYMSVKDTNEAFKLGVNYIIYAMTH